MKKIKWATHKSLFGTIASSSCLLAVSAGIVFGISAGTFKVEYFNLNDANARLAAAVKTNYYSQNISSQWNMNEKRNDKGEVVAPAYERPMYKDLVAPEGAAWWQKLHGDDAIPLYKANLDIDPAKMEMDKDPEADISSTASAMRKKYGALVIDGATHTALDRSFNQSLYNGMANFITNKKHYVSQEGEATVYKPAQDSTQEFVNIYREAVKHSRVLCLAGFNHVTPLNALGKQNGAVFDFGQDQNIKNAGMLLIDGDVSNNQNIASVLFRSDQPGFLAALSTCMYFFHNLDLYHEGFKDLSVAAYGGTAIPTVIVYMGGFQRGIEFFNHFVLKSRILQEIFKIQYLGSGSSTEIVDNMVKASKYRSEIEPLKGKSPSEDIRNDLIKKLYDEYSVKMIKLGGFNTNFSGSFTSGDAIGITKQFLNRGASAIIAVAGPQSLDSAQEIMNQNKSTIVIGVDTAMENSDYQKPFKNKDFTDKTKSADGSVSAQAGNIIKFSAVKDMTSVSDKILRLAAKGENWDITIKEPWTSTDPIPYWDPAKEEIPASSLKVVKGHDPYTGIEIYEVVGFTKKPEPGQHVLHIPGTMKIDGKDLPIGALHRPAGPEQQCTEFDADTLKNVDTLIISAPDIDNPNISLGWNTFGFSNATSEQMKTAGFKYIDMSGFKTNNISLGDQTPFDGMVKDSNSFAHNRGIIKFKPGADGASADKIYKTMFPYDFKQETGTKRWGVIEADPYKSVASFGFKTCGNIENGLISISWDGWPFLVEALSHIPFIITPGTPTTFVDAWQLACHSYEAEDPGVAHEFFVKNYEIKDVKEMMTFNRDSIWCKYYPHTMAVLGRLLKNAQLPFSSDMTIIKNEKGEFGKLPDGTNLDMSILEWLQLNMYFIS